MNRRIEHITRLNADARKNYSEPFMVKISYDTNMKVFTSLFLYFRNKILLTITIRQLYLIVRKLWNRWSLSYASRLSQERPDTEERQ